MTTPATPTEATLHQQIMNLPVDLNKQMQAVHDAHSDRELYRTAFHDARHAAAELATAHDAKLAALLAQLTDMEARKDGAYLERNQCVAGLAAIAELLGYRAGTAKTAIEGWSEDWHGCVYIDLPTGQVSWHYHDSQAYLFSFLPPYIGEYDGHDTPEKYRRVGLLPLWTPIEKPETSALLAENARLRELVEKLPTSRDGKTVMPGDIIYCPTGHPIKTASSQQNYRCTNPACYDDWIGEKGPHKYSVDQCYSTRELAVANRAAVAAAAGEGEKHG